MEEKTGGPMKAASILLALVVVGFFQEARADTNFVDFKHRYTVDVDGQMIGFVDGYIHSSQVDGPFSRLFLGPLGPYEVPFSATQGLIGFCLVAVMLIVLLVAFAARVKMKRAAQ
jgi:hypothetical protein